MEKKHLSLDDFILQNLIGSGSFGKVHRVKERNTGVIYAAKISYKTLDTNLNSTKLDIYREVDIISKLNHPSVLKFITFSPFNFKKKSKPVIITEFASNGSLEGFLSLQRSGSKTVNFDDTNKLIIIFGIASGMSYLHEHDIIHRDLKPDNILLDDFLFPKIADFGLSKISNQNESKSSTTTFGSIKGTPKYMSPEIWRNAEYSKASDVYAFSLILYEVITNEQPFNDFNFFEICLKVIQSYRPKFPKEIPESYKNLIEKCWDQDPQKRPTFIEILDQLKNNRGFITDKIDEEKFRKYIDYIENYKTSFNEFARPINFESIKIHELSGKIIENDTNAFSFISEIYPFQKYMKLKEDCKKIVQEAEKDPKKQYEIGIHLIKCQYYFPQDIELGIKYLRKSIKGGCKDSLIYYFKMLIKGKVIPQNIEKARKLLDNNILKNDKGTYYFLLGLLEKKQKEYKKAIEYFEKSINEGNCYAMCEYGTMFLEGNGVTSNEEKAFKYYQQAAKKGCVKALFLIGKMLKVDNDDDDGVEYLKLAADKGYSKAQYIYGFLIEDDDIEVEDEMESLYNIRKSAIQGNIQAMNYIIYNFYGEDEYPYKDDFYYFIKSASDKGDIGLIYYLGEIIIRGENGVKANPKEGAKYVRIAAENGFTPAITSYGELLLEGIGVEIDKELALEFFLKGIEKDDSRAMFFYSTMLKNGDLVQQDFKKAMKYLKMSIDKDCSTAINYYGDMLRTGDGIPVDKKEAIKYYKKAIKNGNTHSMVSYADMLCYGDGIPSNKEKAIKYYKKAIEKGSSDALHNYALLLSENDEKKSKEEALEYFKELINIGDESSMYNYAVMLLNGDGIEKNEEEAIKYLKMAIEKEYSSAMYIYGRLLIKRNEEEEGMKYLNMSIEKGNVEAMKYYGDMLFNGDKNIEMNKEEGLKYYKMAADNGSVNAMLSYADIVSKGDEDEGIEINKEESNKYYKMAADTGDIEAIKIYAFKLFFGNGIKANMEESLKYIKIAMDKGDLEAINYYAEMLFTGNGVEIDEYDATKYLKIAIDKGYPESMFIYAQKSEEVYYLDRALKYYKMAYDKGYSEAKDKYKYLTKTQRITRTKSLPSLNKALLRDFNKVNEKGKYNIINAECFDDKDSIFYVADSLINGNHHFTKNPEDGLKYLEKACKKKNLEAISSYMKIIFEKGNNSLNNRSKMFDVFNDFISFTNLTELKMKFIDILLSKESFDVNIDDRNNNINYVLIKQICKECVYLENEKALVKYGNLCLKEKKSKFGEIHNNYNQAYECFELAAKKGNGEGMVQYGRFNEYGFGYTKKNPEKALKYYKLAYEKGDLNGYAFYGISLIEGIGGITKNIPEGIRLIKYSCDQKNIYGMTFYAYYLFYGLQGLPENKKLSFHYSKIAADLGCAKALRDLGVFYKEGIEVEKDINKSIKYFKMAIEEGDIHAAYLLGDLLCNGDEENKLEIDLIEGNKYLEYAADRGDEIAIYDCLLNVIFNDEIKMSTIKLVKYLQMGVDFQNKDIIFIYGTLLCNGLILHYDEKKAAKYIKMSADLGCEKAILKYAEFLETGFGVERNLEEAKRYRGMIIYNDE